MKSATLAVAAAIVLTTCGSVTAKKPPVPAPNISASLAITVDVHAEQLPPSVPIYDESVSLSLSHSFEITSQQESALQSDTLISVLGVEFTPGDDPNFGNGDNSATVNTAIPLGLGVSEELPVTIKVKWGNGKFAATVKGKLKQKDVALPAPPETVVAQLLAIESVEKATITPRQDVLIETTIKHPSIPDLIVEANLAADVEQTMTQGSTAEGATYIDQIVNAKSKFFAPLP